MEHVFSQYLAHFEQIMQFKRKIKAIRAMRTKRTLKKTISAEITLSATRVTAFAAITDIMDATHAIITVLPNLQMHFVMLLPQKQGNKRSISIMTKSTAEIIAKIVITGMMFVINRP